MMWRSQKRHQGDTEVNHRYTLVLRDGAFARLRWTEVVVGDIVKVQTEEFFPADLVLLASSEPLGTCHIETSSLDGETNLKSRRALRQTAAMVSEGSLSAMHGHLECEPPNSRLDTFVGTLSLAPDMTRLSLGADQLLPRAAQLRNAAWITGIVAYTGMECKLLLNATAAPIKRSNVEVVTNRQILNMFLLFLSLVLCSTVASRVWLHNFGRASWYLGFALEAPPHVAISFLTFWVLYTNLIPISLIVTVDMVKFFQALVFINSDLDLYHAASDTPARARTSALNEELGQVQYLFTDKTGTLTCNVMQFLKCSIGGVAYGDPLLSEEEHALKPASGFYDPELMANLTRGHPTAAIIKEWLTVASVCHTVVIERNVHQPGQFKYQASSPDEAALVDAVRTLGFSFNQRTPESLTLNILGQDTTFQILNILEFSSARARMSVVVRTAEGKIKLFCKGSDTVILERLDPSAPCPFLNETLAHLKKFASDGLRTLCLASADISDERFERWSAIYSAANTSLDQRAQKLEQAAELIECVCENLALLGVSAVEDKLQAGVPATIRALSEAGINIWMLTGDKQETAINIGLSCVLITPQMQVYTCVLEEAAAVARWMQDTTAAAAAFESSQLALVMHGASLVHALQHPLAQQCWLNLAKRCQAVICCRVSPSQKADIVRLVKNSDKAITLAIGDGANDVGMIQAAHVGVGISGQEGLQAARAADYSIAQFRYLQKLLLVHGFWSYRRVAAVIHYTLYKNAALYLTQLWFAFYNGWSGQVLFERWMIVLYNVVFTLFPALALGICEQFCGAETLMQTPQLYRAGQRREHFNVKTFWINMLNATVHSLLVFFIFLAALRVGIIRDNGSVTGLWFLGCLVYGAIVTIVTLKAAFLTTTWTWPTHVAIWGELVIWLVFTLIYFNMWGWHTPLGEIAHEVYGVATQMYSSGLFYFTLVAVPIVVLGRDAVFEICRFNFFPSAFDRVRRTEALLAAKARAAQGQSQLLSPGQMSLIKSPLLVSQEQNYFA